MKSVFYTTLYLLFSLLLFSSTTCKKPPVEPPDPRTELEKLNDAVPMTTEGKNTFGCLVNGKLWLPRTQAFSSIPDISADFGYSEPLFHLSTNYYPDNQTWTSISLILYKFNFAGDSVFINHGGGGRENFAYYGVDKPEPASFYKTDSLNTGFLKFTRLDTSIGIASGTFEFTGMNDKGELVHITHGRFDAAFPKPAK